MVSVVLYQPEIPPNTGNIIRLCANTGSKLHLIKPYGFNLSEKQVRRAGLDYHAMTFVQEHESFDSFLTNQRPERLFGLTTKGSVPYTGVRFEAEDYLLFGPETRGLPNTILASLSQEHRLRIPMVEGNRSLNLANSVSIILYEAWRQMDFIGGR